MPMMTKLEIAGVVYSSEDAVPMALLFPTGDRLRFVACPVAIVGPDGPAGGGGAVVVTFRVDGRVTHEAPAT